MQRIWKLRWQLSGLNKSTFPPRSYAMTDKVLWRGICNRFNPSVTRFCACRFLPAVLLAVLLPIFTVRNLVPRVAREAAMRDAGCYHRVHAEDLRSY